MTEKNREARLRRKAARQGLRIVKSRRRNPRAPDYGGYWLVDRHTNVLVAGDSRFGMSLDQAEVALSE